MSLELRLKIDKYIDSISLDTLMVVPWFFLQKQEMIDNVPLERDTKLIHILNGCIKGSVIDEEPLEGKTQTSLPYEYQQKKTIYDSMTEFISTIAVFNDFNQETIFTFQYLINQFFNIKIRQYLRDKFSAYYGEDPTDCIVFLYKGGTTLKILYEKYKKLFTPNNTELFRNLEESFKRSDSDYQIFIDKNKLKAIGYTRAFYDMNVLAYNILDHIKIFFNSLNEDELKHILPLNINDDLLKTKLAGVNSMLADIKTKISSFDCVEKFIGITLNDKTVMTELICEPEGGGDIEIEMIEGKPNDEFKVAKCVVNTKDDFYITGTNDVTGYNDESRLRSDHVTKTIHLGKANKSNGIYTSFNETTTFLTRHPKTVSSFNLLRAKINIILYYKTHEGKYGYINTPSELIDVSISKINDIKIQNYDFNTGIKKYTNSNLDCSFEFNSYTLYGFINDLYKMLFVENVYPWEDPKYSKKINRIFFLILIYLNNIKPVLANEFIKNFKQYLVNGDFASLCKYIHSNITGKNISKLVYDLVDAIQNVLINPVASNDEKDKFKATILNVLKFNGVSIESRHRENPEHVPYLKKYLKYKHKYLSLSKKLKN